MQLIYLVNSIYDEAIRLDRIERVKTHVYETIGTTTADWSGYVSVKTFLGDEYKVFYEVEPYILNSESDSARVERLVRRRVKKAYKALIEKISNL